MSSATCFNLDQSKMSGNGLVALQKGLLKTLWAMEKMLVTSLI